MAPDLPPQVVWIVLDGAVRDQGLSGSMTPPPVRMWHGVCLLISRVTESFASCGNRDGKMKTRQEYLMDETESRRRNAGFTLVEVILVASIVGLMAAISVPALTKATAESQKKVCMTNLRLIEDAVENVMVVSNFVSTESITVEMVNPHLKVGDINELSWPKEVAPPDDDVLQASGTNGVYVIFQGKRLFTGRSG